MSWVSHCCLMDVSHITIYGFLHYHYDLPNWLEIP